MTQPTPQQIREYARHHTQIETRKHFGITRRQLLNAIGEITMRKPWHDPDVFAADLRKFKNNVPLLAKYYGVSESSVYSRKKRLAIPNIRKSWGKKADNYILMNIHIASLADIAKHLKRTTRAVAERARHLGISYKAALGYTNAMLAEDLQTSSSQISTWAEKNGLPYDEHKSGHRSYDLDNVYTWLEAGNILRLINIDKCSKQLQQMHAEAMQTYVGALELATYGFDVHNKQHARALKPHCIGRMWGFGHVYERAAIYDYVILWVPTMKTRALPDESWFAALIADYHERYIQTNQLAVMIGVQNITGSVYAYGFPRPVKSGIHSRAEVIAWLQSSGKYPQMLKGLTSGK
jgi:DNA-binding transcriptional MerR regulator